IKLVGMSSIFVEKFYNRYLPQLTFKRIKAGSSPSQPQFIQFTDSIYFFVSLLIIMFIFSEPNCQYVLSQPKCSSRCDQAGLDTRCHCPVDLRSGTGHCSQTVRMRNGYSYTYKQF